MLLMPENVYPLPAVRGPEQREHRVGLMDIYFNEELSAGDPAKPGPRQGGRGVTGTQGSREGPCRSIRCLCCN